MCGIAGFAGRGDAMDLHRMSAALAHRGPEADATWSESGDGLQLANRRLAVVDPATGAQPMWTPGRELGVVFNGEIYNHRELRRELEQAGHHFASDHSDTEVLLHGWRAWGEALVPRLNGMWAFALLDRARRRLFLSRDRFGQKPLYWTRRPGLFAFASEARALVAHAGVPSDLSPAAVRKYFAHGYVPAPHAIYEGVWKLPAGCNLTVSLPDGEPKVAPWWEFRLEPEDAPAGGPDAWAQEVREKLERAVARRVVADVPVGVFLSGGIDSSAVAAAAARHTKPGELRTFSIGFEEASFDESRAAAQVARLLGSEHTLTYFSAERARAAWPGIAARLDEPLADASLLPTYVLCGAAREQVTVALGGDGADELFAGYDPFRALRAASAYARAVPRPVHAAVRLLASQLPVSHRNLSFDFKVKRALGGLCHEPRLWNAVWLAPLEPREIAELLGEPIAVEELYAEAIAAWDAADGLGLVDRTLQFFTRVYLQNDILTKVDRASMMHGLEVRAPFLDIELVDLVRRLPADCKLRGGETKWLLKRALEPWLPDAVRRRPKKGFGVPVGAWLAAARPPFDGDLEGEFARQRLAEHRAGGADHRLYLYAQWVLDHFGGLRNGAPA
ncbi:MAG: asparagine synthase (glutamine-hydrolyzing) [Myxococcota bacterium]